MGGGLRQATAIAEYVVAPWRSRSGVHASWPNRTPVERSDGHCADDRRKARCWSPASRGGSRARTGLISGFSTRASTTLCRNGMSGGRSTRFAASFSSKPAAAASGDGGGKEQPRSGRRGPSGGNPHFPTLRPGVRRERRPAGGRRRSQDHGSIRRGSRTADCNRDSSMTGGGQRQRGEGRPDRHIGGRRSSDRLPMRTRPAGRR